MEAVVEMDKKGRIIVPSKLRKGLFTKRMVVRRVGDRLELTPLPDPKSLKGKYKMKGTMEEIEDLQEQRLLERD